MSPLSCPRGVCGSAQSNRNVVGVDLAMSHTALAASDVIWGRGQTALPISQAVEPMDGRLRSLQQVFTEALLCVRPCSPEQSSRNYFLKCYALAPSPAASENPSPLTHGPRTLASPCLTLLGDFLRQFPQRNWGWLIQNQMRFEEF